ncbi:Nicastrin, small lobe [Dillenia turbinata]|uniref:Nicastrin n=1 Tax=Dillenia turbinata TaxID=194707 RepID=A0AAN8UMY6_9MAGN
MTMVSWGVEIENRISLGISLSSMATTTKLICIVLCLLPHLHPSLSGRFCFDFCIFCCILVTKLGQMGTLESVPELEKSMYITLDGYPCVRLLNLSGEIGCANPGHNKVVAPILKFDDALELAQAFTVLASQDSFMVIDVLKWNHTSLEMTLRTVPAKIRFFEVMLMLYLIEACTIYLLLSKDSKFAMNIGGVLVESKTELQNESDGFSPVDKFPQAEFAPYERISYKWNPNLATAQVQVRHLYRQKIKINRHPQFISIHTVLWALWGGSWGLILCFPTKWTWVYEFPRFHDDIMYLQVALKNAKGGQPYAPYMVEFNLVMQTTKAGTHNSESCLKEWTCLPLGGYRTLTLSWHES